MEFSTLLIGGGRATSPGAHPKDSHNTELDLPANEIIVPVGPEGLFVPVENESYEVAVCFELAGGKEHLGFVPLCTWSRYLIQRATASGYRGIYISTPITPMGKKCTRSGFDEKQGLPVCLPFRRSPYR